MSMIRAFFCLVTLLATIGTAQADEPAQVDFHQTFGAASGRQYGMKWASDGTHCQISQANPGTATAWKDAPAKSCERTRNFLRENDAKLSALASPKPHRKGRTPGGILSFGQRSWFASVDTAPRCDVTLTHCESPKLDLPSQLALILREDITAQLGRLPVVSGRN